MKSIDLDIWTPEQMEVSRRGWKAVQRVASHDRTSPRPDPLIAWSPWLADTQNIQKWGNKRANAYWERHLKAGHVPPEQCV